MQLIAPHADRWTLMFTPSDHIPSSHVCKLDDSLAHGWPICVRPYLTAAVVLTAYVVTSQAHAVRCTDRRSICAHMYSFARAGTLALAGAGSPQMLSVWLVRGPHGFGFTTAVVEGTERDHTLSIGNVGVIISSIRANSPAAVDGRLRYVTSGLCCDCRESVVGRPGRAHERTVHFRTIRQ